MIETMARVYYDLIRKGEYTLEKIKNKKIKKKVKEMLDADAAAEQPPQQETEGQGGE